MISYTKHYSRWHPDTEEHRKRMEEWNWRKLEHHLPPNKSAAMLDIGCGMGFLVSALLRHGYTEISGIDLDEGQVSLCQKNKLPCHKVDDSIEWLRDRHAKYSVIFCMDVIEHIPISAQVEFIEVLSGALEPGGLLICTVPNANASLGGRWRYIDYTHTISFTEISMEYLLAHGNFSEIIIKDDVLVPRHLWLLRPSVFWWLLARIFRLFRRLEFIAEFGPRGGINCPLTLNLFCVSKK
jgi:2-polyprenyl-3-methyl-5-hydroxy-6-metoxy-1,4-benzoquinol methylase